jgi:transmembrane protein
MTSWSRSTDAPEAIVRLLDNALTLLVARVCVTLPFLEAGIIKLMDWQAGEAEMLRSGLHPAWVFNLASLVTELGGSVLIIINRKTWLGAGALGIFTVIATFLAHRFWDLSGQARIMQLNTFLEHATISAAFILVVVVGLRPRRQLSDQRAVDSRGTYQHAGADDTIYHA